MSSTRVKVPQKDGSIVITHEGTRHEFTVEDHHVSTTAPRADLLVMFAAGTVVPGTEDGAKPTRSKED